MDNPGDIAKMVHAMNNKNYGKLYIKREYKRR